MDYSESKAGPVKIPALIAIFLFMTLFPLSAEEWEPEQDSLSLDILLNASLTLGLEKIYDEVGPSLAFDSDIFHMFWDFSFINDDKYTPSEPYLLGHYFSINNGGILFDLDFMELKGGRLVHSDDVESPYSLFISSAEIPAVLIDFSLDIDFFFYRSRWIRLNTRSEYGFPERGANYKMYGLKLGDLRLGFQDSVIYLDRSFDVEYFLNPLPQYFVQLVTTTAGKPWTETGNTNSIIGFFVDFKREDYYAYTQFLIDDLNLGFLVPDREINIPSKIAWSLGGYYDFFFGRLGFYHAGATKYSFAATYSHPDGSSQLPYEYTYYPAVQYLKDGSLVPIEYVDNYLGYKYGENNLAFQIDYGHRLGGLDLGARLEYVLSGAKSPANPWHGVLHYSEEGGGTHMFDYPYLEHRIEFELEAAYNFGPLRIWVSPLFGGIFNELQLEAAEDGGKAIYRPQENRHRALLGLSLGLSYLLDIR